MKKLIISAVLALTLVAVLAVPAVATEQTQPVTASVTVTEVINATITDNGDGGLGFGTLNKGTVDEPEAAQGASNGAVTIVVAADTSVNCYIEVKATHFQYDTTTLFINNAKYGTTNDVGSATAFTDEEVYFGLGTHIVGDTATTVEAYHWLSIPEFQVAGSYSSTFTYRVGN